jgi:23S rRNA (cytosine1962-C5)-methyltransferase
MPREWEMDYKGLKFMASTSGSRHLGLFPEQADHWDWIEKTVRSAQRPVKVLNLFGYSGLASLAAARAGANVTHVDASRINKHWPHNQELTNLPQDPFAGWWMMPSNCPTRNSKRKCI